MAIRDVHTRRAAVSLVITAGGENMSGAVPHGAAPGFLRLWKLYLRLRMQKWPDDHVRLVAGSVPPEPQLLLITSSMQARCC
jgi:hypothetical protein